MTLNASPAPLHIVGLGPGHSDFMAPAALAALQACKVIAGYKGYVASMDPALLAEKRIISTGMTGETARARAAIDEALAGHETCLVCSGDPGVYALAGLIFELIQERGLAACDIPLHVVPGIPALCAAASILGAPLTHDFACVSLSDLLTPWRTIIRRLDCALAGDFVVVIYNPRSKRRNTQLYEALELAKKHREPATPVGMVRNAFRPGQEAHIIPLGEFKADNVDMFTILIIGNSETRVVPGKGGAPLDWSSGARMCTPRGYARKYSLACEKNL